MLVTLLLLFSRIGEDSKQSQDFIVRTAQATPGFGQSTAEFPFIAQSFCAPELSFCVGDPIDRFEVYVGDSYKQGSIIAETDPRDFCIRKERTEAIYCQAKAKFERIEKLYERNNVSASTYEKAKADYTAARAALDTTSCKSEDTRLIALFNEYVGKVHIEKFQDVEATQPVIPFIDIDRLKMKIYVTQDIAFVSHPGDTVQIRFDARPDKIYKAGITEIPKGTTHNNLSYLLAVILPNEKGELPAGVPGKAIFDVSRVTNPTDVSIPQTAPCHRPSEGDYVWVVNTDTYQVNRRQVKKGNLFPSDHIIIIEELQDNETATTSGSRFLSGGTKVTIPSEANSL